MCARNTRILSDRALLPIRTKTGWCALLRRDSPFALAAAGSASLIQRKFDDQKPGDRNFCSSIAAPLFQPAGRHRLAAKENFRLITLCGKPRPRGPCKLRPIHNSMSGFRPDRHRKRTRRLSGCHFLNRLQLRSVAFVRTNAIRWHLNAVFVRTPCPNRRAFKSPGLRYFR